MRRYLAAVSLFLIFPSGHAADAQTPVLEPGRYEVTIGSQGKMGKFRICLPEEDIYLALSDVILDRGKEQMRKECSIRITEQSDSGAAWETLCENGLGKRTTSGTMGWDTKSFKGQATFIMPGIEMDYPFTGVWLGQCS